MAAITSDNVTVYDSFDIGTKSGQSKGMRIRCGVTLAAQGATALDIPATAFGLSTITGMWGGFLDSTGTYTGILLGRNPSGTYLFPCLPADGTPVNLTGVLHLWVEGYPSYPTTAQA